MKFNMCNAIIWFIGAKFLAGKVKPPEENRSKLSHYKNLMFSHI